MANNFFDTAVLPKSALIPPINNNGNTIIIRSEKLYEYLLLLSPNGFIRERLITEKKYFSEVYENVDAAHSLPHITLANFLYYESSQNAITHPLELLAKRSNRIKVVLENYKWFSYHTIYFNVKYKIDIQQLVRKIIKAIKGHIKADNKNPPHFILTPHLTLCKGMTKERYQKSLAEYSEQIFSDKFIANEMVLLKRSVGMPENYKLVGKYKFGGLEEACDTTTQLFLF